MKRRTQGQWSIEDRYAQFAAGNSSFSESPHWYLIAVNDLMDKGGDKVIEYLLGRGHRLLMDSGIFNLTNKHMRKTGCTMDYALGLAPDQLDGFEPLFNRYVELATRWGDQLWGYIELDQGGKDNKRITRAKLHDAGLDPIPVYHPINDGWDYFDELAEGFERICMGNVVQADSNTRVRLLHTLWERHRAHPDLWVHVLGLTPNDNCLAFAPESGDSSSWISGLQWPAVYLGTSMLDPVGRANTDPGFRYLHPSSRDSDAEERSAIYSATVKMYADEVDFSTHIWRRIKADREAELGEVEFPAYMEGEGELCPAQR